MCIEFQIFFAFHFSLCHFSLQWLFEPSEFFRTRYLPLNLHGSNKNFQIAKLWIPQTPTFSSSISPNFISNASLHLPFPLPFRRRRRAEQLFHGFLGAAEASDRTFLEQSAEETEVGLGIEIAPAAERRSSIWIGGSRSSERSESDIELGIADFRRGRCSLSRDVEVFL